MDVDKVPVIQTRRNLKNFEQIYQKWISPVYRYFRNRVTSDNQAEDLTSQVFLKVYEKLPYYRENGHFPAWLFTIVRNQITDHFRANKLVRSLDDLNLADAKTNAQDQATRTEDLERLCKLIRVLPETEKELIRLRFVAQLTYKDIAVILGSTRDAVRKRITRLLARLHNQMEDDNA